MKSQLSIDSVLGRISRRVASRRVAVRRNAAIARAALAAFEPLENRQLMSATGVFVTMGHGDEADTSPPTAEIRVDDVVSSDQTDGTFQVHYHDKNGSIDLSTIGSDDVVLVMPDGSTVATTFVSLDRLNGDSGIEEADVTYSFAAPGGTWDVADNGDYQLQAVAGAVSDTSLNPSDASTASFKVNIPEPPPPVSPPPVSPPPVSPPPVSPPPVSPPPVSPPPVSPPPVSPPPVSPPPVSPPPVSPPPVSPPPVVVDATSPSALISPIETIRVAGEDKLRVSVTFEDAGKVDANSIDVNDLSVLGPGGSPLSVVGVSIVPENDSPKVTAEYTILAPGSSFDSNDNGDYTVTLRPGSVTDVTGNGVASLTAGFKVNIEPPAPVIDTSFSGGSSVNAGFVAEASAAQADGKLLIVGRQGDIQNGSSQYVLKRLNADGSTDGTFGVGGVVSSAVGENQAVFAVVVAADGSIYVAGSKGGDLAITKLKSAGMVDTKFGDKGQVVVDLGSDSDRAYGIALGADGSVVAVGSAGNKYAVVKLTAKGALDGGFGQSGVLTGTDADVLSSVAVMADGRIVAAGSNGPNVVVYRLLSNGFADDTFSRDGRAVVDGLAARTDLGGADNTVGVGLDGDKVLVGSRINGNFAIARLLTDGTADDTFGTGGLVTVDFGGDDDADQIIVQATGQILVVGTSSSGDSTRLAVAVLDDTGALDTNFGDGGTALIDTQVSGRALHIGTLVVRAFASAQTNGQVVVGAGQGAGGGSVTPESTDTGLRRLNVPGSGLLGTFGDISGKNVKRTFVDGDGTRFTIIMRGGKVKALYDGSVVDLEVTESTDSSRLIIKTRGGDGKVNIRNIDVPSGLAILNAATANISGTVTSPGRIGKLMANSLTDATVAVGGGIGLLKVAGDIKTSRVLSGVDLGSDNKLGGTNTAADVFSSASIDLLQVGGAVRGTIIAAGLKSTDSTLLDADDTILDGSLIGSIVVHGGVDAASKVLTQSIGRIRVPTDVDLANDDRFSL